jgi:hypothetical protein
MPSSPPRASKQPLNSRRDTQKTDLALRLDVTDPQQRAEGDTCP